jgi:hypothetical protein
MLGPGWSWGLLTLTEFPHKTAWKMLRPVTQVWQCSHQQTSNIYLIENFPPQS